MLLNGFTVFLKGNWDASSFVASYIGMSHEHHSIPCKLLADETGLPVFAVCYVGWKVAKRTKLIPLAQIDFTSGMRELDLAQAEDEEKYKPDTAWKKFIALLF